VTLELTLLRTLGRDHELRRKGTKTWKMVYSVDENQLLKLWSVICCFEAMRVVQDPTAQSPIITNAQAFLTAFVLDLRSSPRDEASSPTPSASLDQMVTFDA
jgi:hypothetical protein